MISKKNKSFLLTIAILISSSFLSVFAQQSELYKYSNGEGIQIANDNGYLIKIKTYVQPAFETRWNTDSISDDNYDRFRIRRLRLRFDGSDENSKLNYRLQFNFGGVSEVGNATANQIALLDAFVRYNFERRFQLTFGQRSVVATDNRELSMTSTTLQLPERSRVTSSFTTIRDFGLFLRKDIRFRNISRLRNYLEITTGDGRNNFFNKDFGGLKFGGRIDYLPFGTFTNMGQFRTVDIMRENNHKLVFGVNYSYNNGISSRRGRYSGDIIYNDSLGNTLLPDYIKYGFDFLYKYRGFSALGEFVSTNANVPDGIYERVRNDGSTSTEFIVNGEPVDVKDYVKNRLMLGQGYNIQMGYLFKNLWSIDARFTHLIADEFSFLNNGLYYNRPNYYTIGVSKMFNKSYSYKIQASLTLVELDENGLSRDFNDNYINGEEIYFRLITTIAF